MQIETQIERASLAAEAWKKQYFRKISWLQCLNKEGSEFIYEELKSLGNHPSINDVNEIIGNKSWTILYCDECESEVQIVVIFENFNDPDEKANICPDCIKKAFKLLNEKKKCIN